MTEQINQEQAVQVAEWCGVYQKMEKVAKRMHDDSKAHGTEGLFSIKKITISLVTDELYRSEGQEAVMDKLEEKGWHVGNKPTNATTNNPKGIGRSINLLRRDFFVVLRSKTRQHALLLAVLEMLKGGEG